MPASSSYGSPCESSRTAAASTAAAAAMRSHACVEAVETRLSTAGATTSVTSYGGVESQRLCLHLCREQTEKMVRAVLKALLPKATFAKVEAVVPLRQLPQASDLNAAAAWGGVVLVGAVWMVQVSGCLSPCAPPRLLLERRRAANATRPLPSAALRLPPNTTSRVRDHTPR
jgi:hypothetical protein